MLTTYRAETVYSDVHPDRWANVETWWVPFTELLGYQPFYQQYRSKVVERDGNEFREDWEEEMDKKEAERAAKFDEDIEFEQMVDEMVDKEEGDETQQIVDGEFEDVEDEGSGGDDNEL